MKEYQALLLEVIDFNTQDVLTSSINAELNEKDVIFNAGDFFE